MRPGTLEDCPHFIENETFNVLKTNGYNLEHNFGHGKETLASVLVVLNLLAFAFHTAATLAVLAWRQAVIARAPHTGSSSTCERSPPTSYSRTGIICSAHHSRRDTTALTQPPNGHAVTTIVRENLTHQSI